MLRRVPDGDVEIGLHADQVHRRLNGLVVVDGRDDRLVDCPGTGRTCPSLPLI